MVKTCIILYHGNIKFELGKLSRWQTLIEDPIEPWCVGFEQLQSSLPSQHIFKLLFNFPVDTL